MGTIIDRMEMVVLPNSNMWYHIPNNGMVTKSNRNDVFASKSNGEEKKQGGVFTEGCRKVR